MPSDSSSDHDSVDNVEDLREMHPLIELSDSDDSCNEDANGPSNSASDVDDDSGNEEDSSPGDLPRLISVHEMCAEEDREAQAAACPKLPADYNTTSADNADDSADIRAAADGSADQSGPENDTENVLLDDVKPPSADFANNEERIQAAFAAVKRSGFKRNGNTVYSLRKAAIDYGVHRSTLMGRFNGVPTREEAHAHERKLSAAAELVLVDWIKELGRRGVPLSQRAVIDHASDIAGSPLGESWYKRFRGRHPDLSVRWTTSLEECRARSLNRTNVTRFYDVLQEVVERHGIPPENIYNMDEKGVQLGISDHVKVLVDRDQKTVYNIEPGNSSQSQVGGGESSECKHRDVA